MEQNLIKIEIDFELNYKKLRIISELIELELN